MMMRNILENMNIKKCEKRADKIMDLHNKIKGLSDKELQNKTNDFKKRLRQGESIDDILNEGYAVVKEASSRALGLKPHKVQVMGGIILHGGHIAEMKTGEGKTLIASFPAYLNALMEKGVHIITVNDYLAKRDRETIGLVFEYLGLTVGLIQHELTPEERAKEYAKDIVYVTNSELGFDYLRDNLATKMESKVLVKGLSYCIIDEIDSILIDEARTPLIIGGESKPDLDTYLKFHQFAKHLSTIEHSDDIDEDELKGYDVILNKKEKSCSLTDEGFEKAQRFFDKDLTEVENQTIIFGINQALKAIHLFHKDIDYMVIDGKVEIVDEYTGRVLKGRKYSDGLHQAIELKENVSISPEMKTVASITYQSLFNLYPKKSGMTGTAKTEEEELSSVYGMDVVVVPTNKPVVRVDHDDSVYLTKEEKYKAVLLDIKNEYEKGRPVLIGTRNVEISEVISGLLNKENIPHNVLNAKNHLLESNIIKKAGEFKSITIATNMAGRGTDIKLTEETKKLGGLKVIGVERNEARRIDEQLRGRSGRQGDVGESIFYLSLEDDLLKYFATEGLTTMFSAMKVPKGQKISHPLLTKAIRDAQKNIEGLHYSVRKYIVKFDDVLNRQREDVYKNRDIIINGNIKENLLKVVSAFLDRIYEKDEEKRARKIKQVFNIDTSHDINKDYLIIKAVLLNEIFKIGDEETLDKIYKEAFLVNIDKHWQTYLTEMEEFRKEVGLRSLGGGDVLTQFTKESYESFDRMIYLTQKDILVSVFKLRTGVALSMIKKLNKIMGKE